MHTNTNNTHNTQHTHNTHIHTLLAHGTADTMIFPLHPTPWQLCVFSALVGVVSVVLAAASVGLAWSSGNINYVVPDPSCTTEERHMVADGCVLSAHVLASYKLFYVTAGSSSYNYDHCHDESDCDVAKAAAALAFSHLAVVVIAWIVCLLSLRLCSIKPAPAPAPAPAPTPTSVPTEQCDADADVDVDAISIPTTTTTTTTTTTDNPASHDLDEHGAKGRWGVIQCTLTRTKVACSAIASIVLSAVALMSGLCALGLWARAVGGLSKSVRQWMHVSTGLMIPTYDSTPEDGFKLMIASCCFCFFVLIAEIMLLLLLLRRRGSSSMISALADAESDVNNMHVHQKEDVVVHEHENDGYNDGNNVINDCDDGVHVL